MDFSDKQQMATNLEYLFNHENGSIITLEVKADENKRFITGSAKLREDPFIVQHGHPLNVSEEFTKRIQTIVKLVCGKPVHISWNNTGTEFWFDPAA